MEIAKNWIDNQQVARMGNYKGRKLSIIIPVNGDSVTKNVDCYATETQALYNRPDNVLSTRKDKLLSYTNNFEAPFIF